MREPWVSYLSINLQILYIYIYSFFLDIYIIYIYIYTYIHTYKRKNKRKKKKNKSGQYQTLCICFSSILEFSSNLLTSTNICYYIQLSITQDKLLVNVFLASGVSSSGHYRKMLRSSLLCVTDIWIKTHICDLIHQKGCFTSTLPTSNSQYKTVARFYTYCYLKHALGISL